MVFNSNRCQQTLMIFGVFIGLLTCIGGAAVKLPEGFSPCQIDSLDLNECIRSNIERMIPRLSQGFPELNIPALDPMVRNATLYEYKRGPLNVLVHAKATTVYGVSKTQVKGVRSKITNDGMAIELDTYFPHIFLTGDYKADSTYEGQRFSSKGMFNFTFTGLHTTEKMSGHFVDRDGQKFYQLDHFDLDIEMDDFNFGATGIFSDPAMNQMVVTFMNTYWRFVYQQILPQTKSVWEPMFVHESNRFLETLPIDSMMYYGNKDD